jgi:hypothetical protein
VKKNLKKRRKKSHRDRWEKIKKRRGGGSGREVKQ